MIGKQGVSLLIGKQGVQVKTALSAGSETLARGIYNPTTLSAVDADLAAGNIKYGITIFSKEGSTNVRDSSDANLPVGEARTGKTFYAGGGAKKTGSGTKTLNPANETVEAGYYAATTLSAVDAQLAVGNIKKDVNIFGKVGTFEPTLIDDIQGYAESGESITYTTQLARFQSSQFAAGTDYILATKTQAYAAGSRAFAVAFCNCASGEEDKMKLRLYMAGVQVAESGWLPRYVTAYLNFTFIYIKAMSGSQECKLAAHNYDDSAQLVGISGGYGMADDVSAMIAIGSIKT